MSAIGGRSQRVDATLYLERRDGQCQRKANRSAQPHCWQISGSKLTPLCKGDGAIEFEVFASVEVTFLIEVIVDGSVDRGEFL
jgi:hypothetical protein